MKLLLPKFSYLLLFFLSSFKVFCQEYTIDDNKNVSFVVIYDSLEADKSLIFDRAISYLSNLSNKIIDVQNRESGTIVLTGQFEEMFVTMMNIKAHPNYVLQVETKDNKARLTINLTTYIFEDFDLQVSENPPHTSKKTWKGPCLKLWESSLKQIQNIQSAFSVAIRKDSKW